MEQSSSWETNSRSASQEIPRLLQNPKVHYRVHKGPPLDTILIQFHPAHILRPYFFKIHSDITLPSTSSSPKRPDPFQVFRPQFCVRFSFLRR
jgi:hypothetical protein